jgi:hypothetical protein
MAPFVKFEDLVDANQVLGRPGGVPGGVSGLATEGYVDDAIAGATSDYVASTEAEIRAAIAAGIADGSHRKRIFIKPGLITIDSVVDIGAAGSTDFWEIIGSGYSATNLRGTSASGHILNVLGREVHIRDLTISATATRTAGASGNGIHASNLVTSTQSRLLLDRVRVMSQPGHGLYCADPELHRYTDCDFDSNKGDGIRWVNDTVNVWHNTTINCRVIRNTGRGLYCPSGSHYGTHVNLQAWSNAGGQQVRVIGGRGDRYLNPDIENIASAANIAASGYGMQLQGRAHEVLGGHFACFTHGIVFDQCLRGRVSGAFFTNESGNAAMTAGVLVQSNSSDCMVDLASSFPSTSAPYVNESPSTTIRTDGREVGPTALGLVYTVDPGESLLSAQTFGTANRCAYMRVQQGGLISKVGLQVGVSSGNVSVAVYRNSGVGRDAVPGARLATSGAVACPAAGFQEISLGSTVEVRAGDWIGFSCDNITASFIASSTAGPIGTASPLHAGRVAFEASAHPCPSTPTPVAGPTRNFVLVGTA